MAWAHQQKLGRMKRASADAALAAAAAATTALNTGSPAGGPPTGAPAALPIPGAGRGAGVTTANGDGVNNNDGLSFGSPRRSSDGFQQPGHANGVPVPGGGGGGSFWSGGAAQHQQPQQQGVAAASAATSVGRGRPEMGHVAPFDGMGARSMFPSKQEGLATFPTGLQNGPGVGAGVGSSSSSFTDEDAAAAAAAAWSSSTKRHEQMSMSQQQQQRSMLPETLLPSPLSEASLPFPGSSSMHHQQQRSPHYVTPPSIPINVSNLNTIPTGVWPGVPTVPASGSPLHMEYASKTGVRRGSGGAGGGGEGVASEMANSEAYAPAQQADVPDEMYRPGMEQMMVDAERSSNVQGLDELLLERDDRRDVPEIYHPDSDADDLVSFMTPSVGSGGEEEEDVDSSLKSLAAELLRS